MVNIKNPTLKRLGSFLILALGSIIAAFALEVVLIPNTILDGGVTGVGIIISKVTNLPLSIFVILLNIPFIFIGYKSLGKDFLLRTVYSMVIFAAALYLFQFFEPMTKQILLATVYGGVILGVGVGMIIHFGGCIDGTESVSLVISRNTSFSVGQIVLAFNLIIYLIAGFIFGLDRAMYSLLTYFITFKVIDYVSEGLEQVKAALIVTEKGTDMANEIYSKLGRTVTTIRGRGLISGDKEVLYCVLTRIEIFELKHIASRMDKSAFITILEVSDIIGDHIKSTEMNKRRKRMIK